MNRSLRTVILTLVALALGIAILAAGLVIGSHAELSNSLRAALPSNVGNVVLGSEVTFPLQNEVLDKLDRSYYEKVGSGQLQDDAIRGLLKGLDDPYTHYLDPKEYADFQVHSSGLYSGVGMSVESRGDFVTVVSTFKGSPAAGGGLVPGDVILAVDGADTKGLTLNQVVSRIKGKEGTSVKIKVYHMPAGSDGPVAGAAAGTFQLPDGGTVQEVTLVRKSIDVPVVETEILQAGGKKVAHISFVTFSEDSSVKLKQAVEKALRDDKVDVIALDLRKNGGGLLYEAIGVASIFIPKGTIVSTKGLHSPEQVFTAEGGAIAGSVPVYVLVDEFSASASEIVSGALKDTKRATLVGETTFGKGLVQTVEPLSNGGALVATTAVYLTPAGTDINKKGIKPDVVAPDKTDTPNVDETMQKVLELVSK
jgi:carboxyl-terminal processing protease